MKIETILNAFEEAGEEIPLEENWQALARKRERQYRAFRERILRQFSELESEAAWADVYFKEGQAMAKKLVAKDAEMDQLVALDGLMVEKMAEKEARIAELEK